MIGYFLLLILDKKIPNNVDYNYFIQAWSELHRASNNPNFISADELKAMAKESQKTIEYN